MHHEVTNRDVELMKIPQLLHQNTLHVEATILGLSRRPDPCSWESSASTTSFAHSSVSCASFTVAESVSASSVDTLFDCATQCSEPKPSARFSLNIHRQQNLNVIDSVQELHPRSFSFSCDFRCVTPGTSTTFSLDCICELVSLLDHLHGCCSLVGTGLCRQRRPPPCP